MIGEIWRLVPSQPRILASSEGRVMVAPHIPEGGCRQYGGTPHFGVWNKQDGRFIIVLDGKTYKVARLVCEAFHGESPFDRAVVMHADENAVNNRASNLSWGTQKQNLNAPGFLEYCQSRTGNDNPYVKGRQKRTA